MRGLGVGGECLADKWMVWQQCRAEEWTALDLKQGYRLPFGPMKALLSQLSILFLSFILKSLKGRAKQMEVEAMRQKGKVKVEGNSLGFTAASFWGASLREVVLSGRPISPEQLPAAGPLLLGDAIVSLSVNQGRGFHCLHGRAGCIPQHSHSPKLQKVPTVHLQGRDVPIRISALVWQQHPKYS